MIEHGWIDQGFIERTRWASSGRELLPSSGRWPRPPK